MIIKCQSLRNVGAISAYLNRTFTGEFYTRLREETSQFLETIPQIGEPVKKMAIRAGRTRQGVFTSWATL